MEHFPDVLKAKLSAAVTMAVASSPRNCPTDQRYRRLDLALKRNGYQPDALIEILHEAQDLFGFLEPEVLTYVAQSLKQPLSRVYGVATFYHLFRLKPNGRHTCSVCLGTACYVKGSQALLDRMSAELGIRDGQTSGDGLVSLSTVRCIGACGIAPAVVYDGEIAGRQDEAQLIAHLQQWREATDGLA